MTEARPPRDDASAQEPYDEHSETQVLPGSSSGDDDSPEESADSSLEEQLQALNARAEQAREDQLRAIAELDNVRKRSAREVENARRYALERIAGDLLGVVDSLQMGLEAAAKEGAGGALLEGQQATLRQLVNVLERHGVTQVEAEGKPFDPECHEAMSMVPGGDAEPGTVVAVVQPGYVLNGRLLRPARVLVAADADAGGGQG